MDAAVAADPAAEAVEVDAVERLSYAMTFKDHFSRVAGSYATFRPHYPAELFRHLAGLCMAHDLAVDCGTGNGQAALGLAAHFTEVVAVDPSAEQVHASVQHERVRYSECPNGPARSQTLACTDALCAGTGRSPVRPSASRVVRIGKARSRSR